METEHFDKRITELAERCERTGAVTNTPFLTPAEQMKIRALSGGVQSVLFGGDESCERRIAFFLPDYLSPEDLDVSEEIRAIHIRAFYGTPDHRDYLGSILGLGIRREWIGDIRIREDQAWVYCMPSVCPVLTEDLLRAGRVSVKAETCALKDVPLQEQRVKQLRFTVKSPRLDAVCGEIFGISRTAAQEHVRAGLVSLNYEVCCRTDAEIRAGDVLSMRGKGKGRILELGGKTKKDRIFISAVLLL